MSSCHSTSYHSSAVVKCGHFYRDFYGRRHLFECSDCRAVREKLEGVETEALEKSVDTEKVEE